MEFGHRRSKLFTTPDNANISDCIHCKMSSVTNIIRSVCHRICWHSTRIENVGRLLLLCACHDRELFQKFKLPSRWTAKKHPRGCQAVPAKEPRVKKTKPAVPLTDEYESHKDLEPESIQIPHFLQKLRTRVKLCACQYVCLKCIHHWHYMAQINPLAIQGGKVQGTAYLQRSVLLHELASCL